MTAALTIALPEYIAFRDDADRQEFGVLPDACRADIRQKYAAIRRCMAMQHARGISDEWKRLARDIAGNKGGSMTGKTLRNIGSRYMASGRHHPSRIGDWRILRNSAKWPSPEYRPSLLPEAFIRDEWHARVLAQQDTRKTRGRFSVGGIRQAYKKLIAEWRRALSDGTHPFKGYPTTPPPAPGMPHPAGWSYKNLADKRNIPTELDRMAVLRGVGIARQFLPQVRSTRVNVLAGQLKEIDDYCPQMKIRYGGEVVSPLQLSAYDFGTGSFCDAVFKPEWTRESDGAKDGWKAGHITLFLAAHFTRHPYDAQAGTILRDEGGTAMVPELTAELLAGASRGCIMQEGADPARFLLPREQRPKISRPNRERLGQLNGFLGGDHGNPNRKRMERTHHTLGHYYGTLPGYTGANYTEKPETFDGIIKEEKKLIKAAASLPAERAALMEYNLLSFNNFVIRAREAIQLMDERDDHALEGWARFTLDAIATREDMSEWTPLDELHALPVATSAALLAVIERRPELIRTDYRLSPAAAYRREVQQGLASGRLQMLHPWDAAEIIASAGRAEPDLRVIRTRELRSAYIAVQDSAMLPEPVVYQARIKMPNGTERELRHGEEIECIFNPFQPAVLFIRSPKGEFLGVAREDKAIDPTVRAEVLAAQAAAKVRRNERLASVREVTAPQRAALHQRREHNAALLNTEAALLPEEIKQRDALADARARLRANLQNVQ